MSFAQSTTYKIEIFNTHSSSPTNSDFVYNNYDYPHVLLKEMIESKGR